MKEIYLSKYPRTIVSLLLIAPISLAYIALQSRVILQKKSYLDALQISGESLISTVVLGPALETAQLMLAAAFVSYGLARRNPDVHKNFLICITLLTFSFTLSHVVLKGANALLSAPMVLLLSTYATYAIKVPKLTILAGRASILFCIHSIYNVSLLLISFLYFR